MSNVRVVVLDDNLLYGYLLYHFTLVVFGHDIETLGVSYSIYGAVHGSKRNVT